MPDTPEQFARKYLPVTATSAATGEVKCVVWKYVSYPQKYDEETKKKLPLLSETLTDRLNKLTWYYKSRADEKDSGVEGHGGYVLTIKSLGIFQTNIWTAVQQCFLGKGTPKEFQTAVLLYANWDRQTRDRKSGFKPSKHWASVQQFADENWGVDCNGFVGAYFQENFPKTGLGPTSDIPTGASWQNSPFGKGGTLRTGLDQLRPGDVFLYKGHRHIALLGDMEMLIEGDKADTYSLGQFRVYQARGTDAGGVQGTYYEIKHKGDSTFEVRCVLPKVGKWETLKAIVRPAGVPEWS